ncbi:MAG: hypothetical protein IK130_02705 [Oscillospiraceae bacterium]|nr:hypothetical protein [Oscillospiraceae bacterium]
MRTAFQTPGGILRCTDSAGTDLPFCVIPLEQSCDTKVFDLITEEWIPVRPAAQYEILIDTDAMPIGAIFTLRLHSDLHYQYGASDENALCTLVSDSVFSLSLGAFDPNDAEKDRQAIPFYQNGTRVGLREPAQYDTAAFRGYLLTALPDWSGFTVQLLDRSIPQIRFRLAWIFHSANPEIEAETDDFDDVVTLITLY